MFLFVVYALAVWFPAFRWRRRLAGLVSIAAGLIGLQLFNTVHGDVAAFVGYDANVFRVLLYPYMGLVGVIGLYLCSFPRELPRGRLHCRACWYDLSELEHEIDEHTPCPECGTTRVEAKTLKGRRAARRATSTAGRTAPPEIRGISLTQNDTHADTDQQHPRGEPREQQPAEQPQL